MSIRCYATVCSGKFRRFEDKNYIEQKVAAKGYEKQIVCFYEN